MTSRLTELQELLEGLLDPRFVARLGGPYEIVVTNIEMLPEGLELGNHLVGPGARFDPGFFGDFLDVGTVFVGAC